MRASASNKRHAPGMHRTATMGRNDVVMKMPQKPPDPEVSQPGKGEGPAVHCSYRMEDNHAGPTLGWEKAPKSHVNLSAPATLLVESSQQMAPFQAHSSIGLGPSHLSSAPLALAPQMCGTLRTIPSDGVHYPCLMPDAITHTFEVGNFQKTFGSLHEMPSGLSTVTFPPRTQCAMSVTPTTLGPMLVSPAALNTVPIPAPAVGTVSTPAANVGSAQVPYSSLGAMPLSSAVLGTMLVPSAILGSMPGNSTTLGAMPSAVLLTGSVPSASLGTGVVPTTAVSSVPVFSVSSAHCSTALASLSSLSAPSVAFCNTPVQSFALNTTPLSCGTVSTQAVSSATLSTMPIPSVTVSPTLLPSAVPLATAVTNTTGSTTAFNNTQFPSTVLNSPVPSVTLYSTQTAVTGLHSVQAPCTTCGSSSVKTSSLESVSTLSPAVILDTRQAFGSIDTLVPSVDNTSNNVQSLGLNNTHAPPVDIGIPSATASDTQIPSGSKDTIQVAQVGVGSIQEMPADLCSTHMPSVGLSSTLVASTDICSTPVQPAAHDCISPSGFDNTNKPSIIHHTTQVSSPSCSSLVPFATIGNLRLPSNGLGPQVLYATISSSKATPGGVINLQIPPGTYINFQVPPGSLSSPLQATTTITDSRSQKLSSEPELLQAIPSSPLQATTTGDSRSQKPSSEPDPDAIPSSPHSPEETLMDVDNALPGSPFSSNIHSESCPAQSSARVNPELTAGNCPVLDEQVSELHTAQCVEPIQQHSEGASELQDSVSELAVCAKNSKVSSTGEKVVLWTREADRVILTTCQEQGAHQETFSAISRQLGHKTPNEISRRFRELMRLFHTSCDISSEEEEDATSTSNTDQLSDRDLQLSEEEQDE